MSTLLSLSGCAELVVPSDSVANHSNKVTKSQSKPWLFVPSTFYSCCLDKILGKTQFKRKGSSKGSKFKSQVHHDRRIREAEIWRNWSHAIHSQEEKWEMLIAPQLPSLSVQDHRQKVESCVWWVSSPQLRLTR